MNFAIISGSHRKNSESFRVAQFTEKLIKEQFKDAKVQIVNLAENPLPLWDESKWDGHEKWQKLWDPIAKQLQNADAFVVVTPEWSGMVPAGLKNFFLLCGPADIGHKPALIISVSSGIGGTYPVAELRMSSYKNTRLCYIPEHMILRNVKDLLQGNTPNGEVDKYVRERIKYCVRLLESYGKALKTVRENGVIDHKAYPNGV